MLWIVAVTVALFYAHVVEYAFHRWVLHQPLPGFLRNEFVEHSIEHHGKGRLDINIAANPFTISFVASPLLIFCLCLPWHIWMFFVLCLSFGWAGAWTALHMCHHDLGFLWLKRLRIYNTWRAHHIQHHRNPRTNYGAVFPWTDYLFGTKRHPSY